MNDASRKFEATLAVRRAVGLLIGIVGPSSSGKTLSALRLAAGIQRVSGGEIDVIDTENKRALMYADDVRFNHVPFDAPFSPLDYLQAIKYCARRGTRTVVVDSMSHEHEGAGGVLEWQQREVERLMKAWRTDNPEKVKLAAWNEPKAARRRLINELLQLNVNLILTFRAKEKLKIRPGKDPEELGWQPIAGEEFIYEMALQLLLPPASGGVPRWNPQKPAEKSVIKLPRQFVDYFKAPRPLDEDLGEQLARWAAGGTSPAPNLDELLADYSKCENPEGLKALEARREAIWSGRLPAGYKQRLKDAADLAQDRVRTAAGSVAATSPKPF